MSTRQQRKFADTAQSREDETERCEKPLKYFDVLYLRHPTSNKRRTHLTQLRLVQRLQPTRCQAPARDMGRKCDKEKLKEKYEK